MKIQKRFFAYFFVFAIGLTGAAPAFAQDTVTSFSKQTAEDWEQLRYQLVTSIDSPVDQIKQETLKHINFFATYFGDKIDLTEAVPTLIDIYEVDANEGYRIMALTSLHAMGNQSVMQYLSDIVWTEQSPRVRDLTLAALADYVTKAQAL